MSFQSLISGSECAAPSNPLSQVLKHTEGDRSLQQDRTAGPSSSRLHQLPGSSALASTNQHDIALANRFFEGNIQDPQKPIPMMPPHALELAARAADISRTLPELGQAWVMEQERNMHIPASHQGPWAAEFGAVPSAAPIPTLRPQQSASSNSAFASSYMASPGISGSLMPMSMYAPNPMIRYQAPVDNVIEGKGKGRAREADFEAAFAQVAASLSQADEGKIEELASDLSEVSVTDSVQAEKDAKAFEDESWKWDSEFQRLMSAQRDELDSDFGGAMQKAWESGVGDFSGNAMGDVKPIKFDSDGIPILENYAFESNNKYIDAHPSRSLLNEAKALLEQNGSLSEAALLLEAAIQRAELGEGGYESWILLGETRNMDEREEAGMRALMEGVRRAEEAGAPGAGMLSLAISFTNESFDRASHTMLLRWLRARFPSLAIPEETIKAVSTNSSWDTHTRITDMFLTLARNQHAEGVLDPEVQIGLGVLFYTNGEYDRAKDCFEAALSARPKDYLLWNRLGSSLSNGSKPEEALGAYQQALQLRPTYTRAIYNVGVACLNIGAHKEAAEHFLSALHLQETTGGGDTSTQLWLTLRRALLSMDRADLADLAKPEAKTNLDAFRKEGFEF